MRGAVSTPFFPGPGYPSPQWASIPRTAVAPTVGMEASCPRRSLPRLMVGVTATPLQMGKLRPGTPPPSRSSQGQATALQSQSC